VSCASRARNNKYHREHDTSGSSNPNYKHGKALTNYQHKLRDKARHPLQWKARQIAATAEKAGRLIREPCEVCGSVDVQKHHDDYSKPLAVRWLCPTHHRLLHRELSAALT
jgi:hypothetical protein